MYKIVIGRSKADQQKYGTLGSIFLGKQYVKMGETLSLSNEIYLDIARSHVVYICGKRGGGKSYTLGVVAEGVSDLPPEIKQNIAVLMLDTMGIYWSMKYPNKKEEDLLTKWGLKGKGLDVTIFTPAGYFKAYKEQGIPTDFPFSIKPSELSPNDWTTIFELDENSPLGVLTQKTVTRLTEQGKDYSIDDILAMIRKDENAESHVKDAAESRFINAKSWGLFEKEGTPLDALVKGGQVTVLDVSCYATMSGTNQLRALVIALVAQKLFLKRMVARKEEEFKEVHHSVHYFGDQEEKKQHMPVVWLVIDEAHEFLPRDKDIISSGPLITILREGRQPGISLILATQQPAKIHTDVLTQADVLLSHRITAKLDTDALGGLMQSYMREGLDKTLNMLPEAKGAALILDDNNERLFPIQVRPRFTWHGGESPDALQGVKLRKEE